MQTPTAKSTPPHLPRGPHALSRAEVAASQRTRLIASFTRLLAERGYAGVTIGALAKSAAVSRSAFYEIFKDKEDCLLAAYEGFAEDLLRAMTVGIDEDSSWEEFIEKTLAGYLGTLEADPVRARAFIIEMEAGPPSARARRRAAMHGFAALLAARHESIRKLDSKLGPLSKTIYLGLTLGVRELVHERLIEAEHPSLTALAPDVITWITAMVEGATAARTRAAR